MRRFPINSNLKPTIKLGLIDRLVTTFNPFLGLKRLQSKLALHTLGAAGYITPRKNKRSMRGWFTSKGSADFDTLDDKDSSRGGSRDLYMNTPVATAALRRMRTNVVGMGLTLQSRIDREYLNLTDDQADQWERELERKWRLWSESTHCDMTRTNNFEQLQQLAFLSYQLSGDVFALLPFKRTKNFPFALRIQLIEGDQISNPDTALPSLNSKLKAGIEVNSTGTPKAYYIRTRHPGDADIERKWVRVPAFGRLSGRRNVLHIYDKERPGQRRGMPFLAPVMEQLK